MNARQASRRGFLSNLAILTAGVALGNNIAGITPGNNLSPDLQSLWRLFCRQQSGTPYLGELAHKNEIIACKGHEHVEGQRVYLSKPNIIAQPIWIYWAANKNGPSDIIINFYREDIAIVSINQFELKALSEPNDETDRFEAFLRVNDEGARLYTAQTIIGSNNRVSTQFEIVKTKPVFV